MNAMVRACVCAGVLAGAVSAGPGIARAAEVPVLTNAYLFSNWSSPTTVSSLYVPGHHDGFYPDMPAPLPFISFQGTSGVELLLTGSSVTGIRDTGPLALEIDQALTYASHYGDINPNGDHWVTGFNINREVGKWDDVGIADTSYDDEHLNLDFALSTFQYEPSNVHFNPVSGPGVRGYNALIIAEDAAFDPLRLDICSADPGNCRSIISGFDPAAIDSLLARPDFAAADSTDASEMGQVYVFLFDGPVDGLTTVSDIHNYGGERLEVDFIGAATVVPIPGAIWLFGTGLAALAGFARRKRIVGA